MLFGRNSDEATIVPCGRKNPTSWDNRKKKIVSIGVHADSGLVLAKLGEKAPGCDQVHVIHKPRLLSDNGSSYVSGDLAEWLKDKGMKHARGAPYHPQTQGKIPLIVSTKRLPGDLEAQIEAFADHYNHQRYHESINNVTPADVYFGRDTANINQRERIKRKTLETRRLHHRQHAA